MKQVIQNYNTGRLKIEEVPVPSVRDRSLLVKTKVSLISAGTERSKIETAQMNIIEKAVFRLDLVKAVLNNIKQEGPLFTIKKALNKLDMPISLGYSCAGEVIDAGAEIKEYKVGDRVACVGEGSAAHAEINVVPEHFVVHIPDNVDYDEASFVGLGAIALNAVELAQIKNEETVAVIGLGLIGQIVVQILKAKGLGVFGVEIDEDKLSLAEKFGLDVKANPLKDDIEGRARDFTSGNGLDAIIITAASKNNLPIEISGKIARDKGRVILVGAMPIIIPRKEYYEKELYFVISRGFGSGLYYPLEKNRLYAYNYTSRSVKDNMQDFLSLVSKKKVDVKSLITHRFKLQDAEKAYALIKEKKERYIGIVFEYDGMALREKKVFVQEQNKEKQRAIGIGFIGAGSFAQGYLLPVLKKIREVNLIGVSTASGINAKNVARKFGFSYCTTDYNEILNDKGINCVFITTRHNLHAKFVIEALQKGKNVFVEKPLCMNEDELKEIIAVYAKLNSLTTLEDYGGRSQTAQTPNPKPTLMVGFNRRFAPFTHKIKEFFKYKISSFVIYYRVNAGNLASGHWVHTSEGGGRIVGEVCHFVDLLNCITGAQPQEVWAVSLIHPNKSMPSEDNVIITLKFSDGSIATINYNSVGDIAFARERIEIFGDNSVAIVDNFKKLSLSCAGHTKDLSKLGRDMGHKNEVVSFVSYLLNNNQPLIPFNELICTTLTTFKIKEALRSNSPVKIDLSGWTI